MQFDGRARSRKFSDGFTIENESFQKGQRICRLHRLNPLASFYQSKCEFHKCVETEYRRILFISILSRARTLRFSPFHNYKHITQNRIEITNLSI